MKRSLRWVSILVGIALMPVQADSMAQVLEDLRITEIMYHPAANGAADGDVFEFIELYNTGAAALDVSGVLFSDGITYTFPSGTLLEAGAYVVLARDAEAFEQRYGMAPFGVYEGALNNAGELVVLEDGSGEVLADVEYEDGRPWPLGADGSGFSLVPSDLDEDPEDPAAWRRSRDVGGSPGAADPAPRVLPEVVVNEVLPHTDLPQQDAIELFNPTSTAVDLSGWFLTDDPTQPHKFELPDGSSIAAGGYLVFDESHFNADEADPNSFALSSLGEDVLLFSAEADGALTGYVAGFDFGGSANGVPFGRVQTSDGKIHYPPLEVPTLGSANAEPLVGPVVISELMYHPPGDGDEFIEVYNRSDEAVPLFDPETPENTWQVEGIGYTLPPGITLQPGDLLLITALGPDLFRQKYGVPEQVTIVGPFTGALNNGGETIRLLRPDQPTPEGDVALITVDEVTYSDDDPWPEAPDGDGPTLTRKAWGYGSEPGHWVAEAASPGAITIPNAREEVPEERFTLLEPAAPNPFHSTTALRVHLPSTQPVRIVLYDLLGRSVQTLYEGLMPAGEPHTVRIDGSGLAGGVYLVRLEGDGVQATRSVVLVK